MLEKYITFVAYCDYCSEDHTTDDDDFMSAIATIKREGWKVFKEADSSWAHKCPSCQEDERDDGSEFDAD